VQQPEPPIVTFPKNHPRYPASLLDLPDPPEELACLGTLPDLTQSVAIVGTRACDSFARQHTRQLAFDLARLGYVVISGGAIGIDTAAHEGALEAGGITVAVLPTGLAKPYPAVNQRLFEEIAWRGCLISEIAGTVPGHASTFLARNRIIAALARQVVISQAPFASGALSTAGHAQQLKRPILVVPHAPWDPRGQGCLMLLAQGATVCRTSEDVLTLAAPGAAIRSQQVRRRPKKAEEIRGLDDDQRALVEVLSSGPLDADGLCEQSGLPAPRVQRALLMLLLSAVIQEVGSGRYARADYP
jgi:DNA processing protein